MYSYQNLAVFTKYLKKANIPFQSTSYQCSIDLFGFAASEKMSNGVKDRVTQNDGNGRDNLSIFALNYEASVVRVHWTMQTQPVYSRRRHATPFRAREAKLRSGGPYVRSMCVCSDSAPLCSASTQFRRWPNPVIPSEKRN